jgi:rhodanese-related sulfurtransferase
MWRCASAGPRAALLLALPLLWCAGAGAYQDIDAAEARTMIEAGALVLDVRETSEFCGFWEHLENAVLMPWNSGGLAADFSKLPMDLDIIIHCAVGNRSPSAALYLESEGFSGGRLFNMSGGIVGWPYEKEACEPVPLVFLCKSGIDVDIDWRPTTGVQDYDLLRGYVDEISAGPTEVDLGATECLARDTPYTWLPDPPPDATSIRFYLVRQVGGGWGDSTAGLPRVSNVCD